MDMRRSLTFQGRLLAADPKSENFSAEQGRLLAVDQAT
eukprot:SAG11_NODE_615_length_8197_cov_4.551426_6_plen_38_part_00